MWPAAGTVTQTRVDLPQQALNPLGQLLVLPSEIRVRAKQRLELVGLALDRRLALLHTTREFLVVGLGPLAGLLVPFRLAGLCEQDQRSRIGGLGREREVQEDERVRVPAQADGDRVDRDPQSNHDCLGDDVLRRAEEARGGFGAAAESVFAEGPVLRSVTNPSTCGDGDACRPPRVSRVECLGHWSREDGQAATTSATASAIAATTVVMTSPAMGVRNPASRQPKRPWP